MIASFIMINCFSGEYPGRLIIRQEDTLSILRDITICVGNIMITLGVISISEGYVRVRTLGGGGGGGAMSRSGMFSTSEHE